MDFLPNGNIIFTERSGNVQVKRIGIRRLRLLKTIDQVVEEGEGGLLGLALHPNYAKNHFVYVYYTYRKDGRLFNRVVRYTRSGSNLVGAKIIIKRIPGASSAAFLRGALYFAGLRGEALFRIMRRNLGRPREFFAGRFGRLRDVVVGPDGFLYIATNNRDGRGTPVPADDRIIRVDPGQL